MSAVDDLNASTQRHAAVAKLDPAFKAKWVAALRSGEYKQARGQFRGGETLCCLGVAACLLGIPRDDVPEASFGFDHPEWHRFADSFSNESRYALAFMNDGAFDPRHGGKTYRQHTFAEIADYIEANL